MHTPKHCLDVATSNADGRTRALLVGGGIANFTDVAATFRGIIQVSTTRPVVSMTHWLPVSEGALCFRRRDRSSGARITKLCSALPAVRQPHKAVEHVEHDPRRMCAGHEGEG